MPPLPNNCNFLQCVQRIYKESTVIFPCAGASTKNETFSVIYNISTSFTASPNLKPRKRTRPRTSEELPPSKAAKKSEAPQKSKSSRTSKNTEPVIKPVTKKTVNPKRIKIACPEPTPEDIDPQKLLGNKINKNKRYL